MRHKRTCVVTIMFLATIWFARTVYAQADNNGNPTILRALQSLQDALKSFRDALSPSTQANIRFTPPGFVAAADNVTCEVVNVISETRTLRLQLINASGTVKADSGNIAVHAGFTTLTTPVPSSGLGTGPVYCKFTVVDGSRTDIREAVAIFTSASDNNSVPAE